MAKEPRPPGPICVLKVNIQFCAVCRKKTKKTLEKIRGIKAVEIDAERGLVSVCGAVDPSVLSQAVAKKLKTKVELYAYEKPPQQESKKAEGEKCNVQIERMTEPSHNSSGSPGGGHDVGDQHLPHNFYQNEASAGNNNFYQNEASAGNNNFYQNEASARNNSILHLFCDENVNSCSIS